VGRLFLREDAECLLSTFRQCVAIEQTEISDFAVVGDDTSTGVLSQSPSLPLAIVCWRVDAAGPDVIPDIVCLCRRLASNTVMLAACRFKCAS
jgi:hypothetical protein